jgi:enoyl-CoA hydratase/carnithine racemase
MENSESTQLITSSRKDRVLRLTLTRPEKRNALNSALLTVLNGELARAGEDAEISVVILTGVGNVFCAGADLKEMQQSVDKASRRARAQLLVQLQCVLDELRIPILMAVNGPAVGAGALLALSGDGIIMAENASLAFPELSKGIAPYLVAPGLALRLGTRASFELLSRENTVPAALAVQRGWVTSVTTAHDLLSEADVWAQELCRSTREVLIDTKRILRASAPHSIREVLAETLERHYPLF